MPPRKRKGLFDGIFGGLFGDLDGEFERMREQMERAVQRDIEEAQKRGSGPGAFKAEGPHVWGFSMRVGPDGKPVINQFGNVPQRLAPTAGGKAKRGEEPAREPLVDLIEADKETTVVAEVPGVAKEDIRLDAKEDSLEIDVEKGERKYHKVVQFKAPVKPETAKATYKNGVLEVRLDRKASPAKEKSTKIKIE